MKNPYTLQPRLPPPYPPESRLNSADMPRGPLHCLLYQPTTPPLDLTLPTPTLASP